MPITSDQITRAYAFPLEGAQAAFQYAQQNQAQQQRLAEQRRQQAQQQQLKMLDMLNDTVSPLQGGTGTPLDAQFSQRLNDGVSGFTQFARTNNDPVSQLQYIQNFTRGIKSEQDNAKLLAKRVDDATKLANKDYPIYDDNQLKNYFMQQAFYEPDEKGNLVQRKQLSPSIDFLGNFQDPSVASQFGLYNQSAIDKSTRENIGKLYPDVPLPAVPGKQGSLSGFWSGKGPAFASFDQKTGLTRLQSEAMSIPTDGEPMTAEGLPHSLVAPLLQDPAAGVAVRKEMASLKKQYPKADEQQLSQLAAFNVIKTYAGGRLGTQGDLDDSEFKAQHQAQREAVQDQRWAISNARATRAEGRANQALQMRKNSAKGGNDNDGTNPYQLGVAYWNNSVKPESAAGQYIGQHIVSSGDASGLDLNAATQKPFLSHPITKQNMHVILSKDAAGQPLLQTVTEGKKGTAPALKIYKGKDATNFYNSIANQLQFSKQSQVNNYEEAIINSSLLNNMSDAYNPE